MLKFSNYPMMPLRSEEEVTKSLFEEENRLENLPSIPEFYANQEIFVTGFSGFVGKVLVEKLLRSCLEIKTIFVLLRPKKGQSIGERLKKETQLPLFGPIRKMIPHVLDKLVAIEGDVMKLNLGINTNDLERMKNVSIIFHSAASVRFDDSLRDAILMNTRGTREIMRIAETMSKIKVVVHVSTTYSNPDRNVVEEKVYPAYVDWQKTIEICEKYDDDKINSLTQHYINYLPNTYVFSKNLAEHVSNDYKDKLPVVIFRPSIVISSMKEPIQGWVSNFNGPVGLLVGSGLGIVRTMYSNPDNRCDFLPVDVCVKAIIISAWKKAHEPRGEITVYNCASFNCATIKIQQIVDIGKCLTELIPFDKIIFLPGGCITMNRYMNYVKLILFQLLPALIIDFCLKIKGYKPLMTKIQRKVYEANMSLKYFVLNEWEFKNENFLSLCDHVKLADLRAFDYRDCFHHDVLLYMRACIIGIRRYLIMDDENNDQKNRKRYQILKIVHKILCSVPLLFASYFLYYLSGSMKF